jgi:hypothetical protein
MTRWSIAFAVTGTAALLAACSNSNSPQSNLSTASILGEAPAAATGERPGISKTDPMAKPVQVAWTSARAQKCGFNFDPAKLKANYISSEQRGGADAARMTNVDKTYDMTVTKIKSTITDSEAYCSDKRSAAIKADLTRHLAGNYEPNFPEDKKTPATTLLSTYDPGGSKKMDSKAIWDDINDRKNGGKKVAD